MVCMKHLSLTDPVIWWTRVSSSSLLLSFSSLFMLSLSSSLIVNTLFFHELRRYIPNDAAMRAGRFSGELAVCEREAADALANLSHPVARDGTTGEIELSVDASATAAAHVLEQGIALNSEDEQEVAIQTGYESELKRSLVFDLNYPPVTIRKSRHELTEEEKEERRLRRVLANREAAKRTVRRRQAMREELRRKAVDLALENENLKKNKELAAAEYNSLKDKNNNLRMQIAKIVMAEEEETYGNSKCTFVETPPSTSLTFLHDQSPKMPLILSTVFPRFDGLIVQSGPQSIPGIIQQMPNASLGEFKPYDKLESSVMMNTPGTPLCIVSFPWQMQFHAQSYPFHRWPSYPNDHCKTECSTSTPKTRVNMENILESTLKVKTETPDSIDAMPRDFLHNADRYFRPDEGGQLTGLCSGGTVHMTSTSSPFVLPVIARQNHEITQHKVTYSAVGHVAGEPAEMHQEHVTCSNNASAEARRKWRELMK